MVAAPSGHGLTRRSADSSGAGWPWRSFPPYRRGVASKSDSRQKRANRNRARREALAARTSGEAVKRPSRVAPSTAERLEREPRRSGRAGETDPADAPAKGSKAGQRPRRERPPRLGDRPVDIDSLEGGFLRKVSHVPGGLQVILTVGLALVVAVLTGVNKFYPEPGLEKVKNPPLTMTVFEKYGTPVGALLIAIPLVAVLIALAFSLHPQRRRFWIGSSVVIFVSMLFNIVLMNFMVVGGFLVYAAWRSQRIENPQPPRPARPRRGRWGAAADESADEGTEVDAEASEG